MTNLTKKAKVEPVAELKPKREVIEFLLNYSKSLKIVEIENIKYEINMN